MTGETRCRRAFPPTQNLLTIIQQSLDGNKDKKQSKDIIDSWKTTLDKINDNRLREKEGTLEMESKASAALAIIAIILDIITPIVAVSLRRASKPSLPYLLPLLSGLIAGAAGVLAVMSMKSGIHDLANNGEHGGAAIIILFVGAALRILSCGGAARTPSAAAAAQGRLQPPPGVPRNDWIGFLGENYVRLLSSPSTLNRVPGNTNTRNRFTHYSAATCQGGLTRTGPATCASMRTFPSSSFRSRSTLTSHTLIPPDSCRGSSAAWVCRCPRTGQIAPNTILR